MYFKRVFTKNRSDPIFWRVHRSDPMQFFLRVHRSDQKLFSNVPTPAHENPRTKSSLFSHLDLSYFCLYFLQLMRHSVADTALLKIVFIWFIVLRYYKLIIIYFQILLIFRSKTQFIYTSHMVFRKQQVLGKVRESFQKSGTATPIGNSNFKIQLNLR